jgi:hypothetical protein
MKPDHSYRYNDLLRYFMVEEEKGGGSSECLRGEAPLVSGRAESVQLIARGL